MAKDNDATGTPHARPHGQPPFGQLTPRTGEHGDGTRKRKPYRAPDLVRWGTLAEMTQAVGASGRNDGGRKPYRKTR